MEAAKSTSRRDRVAGVLIGTLVGVGAGMLLAPASGKETRQSIKRKADQVAGKVHATATRLENSAREMFAADRERRTERLGVDVEGALGRLGDELKAEPV